MAEPLRPEQLLAHVEWMRRLALALVRDPHEADDLAQDGVHAALAHPPRTDGPVRPWLAGVLRKLARLRARGRGRRARREAAADLGEAPASPEALIERVQTERRITELVLALDEPFRSTLLRRYHEGQSAAEIARAAGIPAGTVRWRLKEGLDRIRAELDRAEDRRWRAVLLPLLSSRRSEAAALLEGVASMSVKKIALLVVALIVLLIGLWSWRYTRPAPLAARPARLPIALRAAAGPRGLPVVASAEPDTPGVLRMQGQVIDAAESPIAGALVAMDANPPRTTTTDANGVFVFPGLRQRVYTLEAQGRGLYAGPVATEVSPTGEPVVLRARPATTVEVTVLGGAGPVPGAHVELRSTLIWAADTDGRGLARLEGVGPGFRPLRVEAPGFAPAAQMLVTDAGPAVERLVVRLEPGVAASGRVVDPEGHAVAGARVWPRSASEPFPTIDPAFDAVTSDRQGNWRIAALDPGSYQFLAGHPDFAQAVSPPVSLGRAQVLGIELRLEGGGQVTGRVRGLDGKPMPDAEVRAAALAGMGLWPELRTVFTDDAGRFRIGGLPRTTIHLLALHAAGTSALATADLGAAPAASVELTLAIRGAIAGLVTDGRGRPLPEAQVTARSTALWTRGPIKSGSATSWDLRGIPSLIADSGGRFRFTGLPEGRYVLSAVRPGAPPDHRALQPSSEASPGDAEVRVTVRGDGQVKGRVLLEDGQPAPAFSLSLGPVSPVPFTGTGGAFLLSAPAGRHRLVITGPTFATRELEDVTVEEGEARELGTVVVKRGRSITGRVLAEDGAPVAQAQVVAGQFLSGGGTQLYIATESGGAQETTSDDDGHFVLSGFEPGPLVVVAERAGRGRSDTVPIPPQQASAQLDLMLRPTGSLDGRVTRDGRPFPDTVVIATRQLGTANFFVMSGPDGRFALDTLAPGPQLLQAFVNRRKDLLLRAVAIEPGQRAHADLEVRTGALALTVEVRGPDGQPVAADASVATPPVAVRDGEPLQSVLARLAPTQPTLLFQAGAPHTFEELPPGRYGICAAVRRRKGRAGAVVFCTERDLTASATAVVTVPASSTLAEE
jgi:RNA polymerase sigma factor (sigma-70 family)